MGFVANVVQRGRTFHFRRRIPADLRQRLGRHELVRSLGTGDIRAAKLDPPPLKWSALRYGF
ncbi:DUF6538 domain-containing protein [Methylorubrum aminovorans]